MKRCSTCGETKPLAEFQKNKKRPDGLQERCKTCRRVHYYKPEQWLKKREYDQARRVELADKLSVAAKDRYANDSVFREQRKQAARDQKFKPGYHARERQRYLRRSSNPEYAIKQTARHRNRRHNDPEYRRKVGHYRRARQARIQLQGKPFTHAEWVVLCERYNHLCLCCGETKPLTPDHIVPVSRGGSSDISNIQPLCIDCNKRKNARTIDYRPDV